MLFPLHCLKKNQERRGAGLAPDRFAFILKEYNNRPYGCFLTHSLPMCVWGGGPDPPPQVYVNNRGSQLLLYMETQESEPVHSKAMGSLEFASR